MPGIVYSVPGTGTGLGIIIVCPGSLATAIPPSHSCTPAFPPAWWMASVSCFKPGIYLSSEMARNFFGDALSYTEHTSVKFKPQPPSARAT
ncbi:hypothetical protein D3C75_979430 [compost metagenome]